MDQFTRSCAAASDYPQNLVETEELSHSLEDYRKKLKDHERRLFCTEGNAKVHLLQLEQDAEEFADIVVMTNTVQLKQTIRFNEGTGKDPICRFIFIHAPNSRARLQISWDMFAYIFTYQQVIPEFLDFVFPFGEQDHPTDFSFSGFRHETRLCEFERGLSIPELGRTGQNLRLCYSLKSPEWSSANPDRPAWSIRQSALCHSFDVQTGYTCWLIIKANQLLKKRMAAAAPKGKPSLLKDFSSVGRAFAASLSVHLILCGWAKENWRWYLKFLEEKLQESTRATLRVSVREVTIPGLEQPKRATTFPPPNRRWTDLGKTSIQKFGRTMTRTMTFRDGKDKATAQPILPLHIQEEEKPQNTTNERVFAFADLQQVQDLEERANEAVLLLKTNANVLLDLKEYYKSIFVSEECCRSIQRDCAGDMKRFERRISSAISDLQMQSSRGEHLLRLVGERKALLYGILQQRNMQVNEHLTLKAQQSTERMEAITHEMHEIARKTERETVSMRIVTMVTLFFLPGTFVSTLMSTDIINHPNYENGQFDGHFSRGALFLYLEISLPLMALTFVAAGINYHLAKRADPKPNQENNVADVEKQKGGHFL